MKFGVVGAIGVLQNSLQLSCKDLETRLCRFRKSLIPASLLILSHVLFNQFCPDGVSGDTSVSSVFFRVEVGCRGLPQKGFSRAGSTEGNDYDYLPGCCGLVLRLEWLQFQLIFNFSLSWDLLDFCTGFRSHCHFHLVYVFLLDPLLLQPCPVFLFITWPFLFRLFSDCFFLVLRLFLPRLRLWLFLLYSHRLLLIFSLLLIFAVFDTILHIEHIREEKLSIHIILPTHLSLIKIGQKPLRKRHILKVEPIQVLIRLDLDEGKSSLEHFAVVGKGPG